MNILDDPFLNNLLVSLLISVVINLLFFIFALNLKTDKITDLAYSLSFIAISLYYLFQLSYPVFFQILPGLMVVIWAIRLGGFLFYRVLKMGRDERFDHMHKAPLKYAGFWTLQGLAVWLISIPLTVFYSRTEMELAPWAAWIGIILWMMGMLLESVSDTQKFLFKSHTPDRWVDKGLWKYARHPNYGGEIILWWGIYIVAFRMEGSGWLIALIGPVFIRVLLLFVSGIPLLEKRYRQKYGNDPEYQKYRKSTSLLFPLNFRQNHDRESSSGNGGK